MKGVRYEFPDKSRTLSTNSFIEYSQPPTSNYSSKLSSFSSLQFPAQLSSTSVSETEGFSFTPRQRNLPFGCSKRNKLFPPLMRCYRILTNRCWLTFMQTGGGPCQFMAPVLDEVACCPERPLVQVVKIDTEKYPSIADKYK
ncbi:hypothetical protein NC652_014412 [Populus alba x Populus x berolinensis]|nr:hypothetical protein NC652_014412 [Populus alba x Populus x berolinensis]